MLDTNRLKEMLSYDPLTGLLTWKTRPVHHFKRERDCKSWNTRYAGRITGCPDPNGYLRVNIRGTPYLAHQLAWAIYYGEFIPFIDHKNLIHSDNKISNLRECTKSQNQHNRTVNTNNTSGYKGVCFHRQNGKWRAYIVLNWKQKHLGLFDTPEEAHRAYCVAANVMHGEFANHGVSQ